MQFFFSCNRLSNEENHKIENIRVFTKLFGYVRYFHPSDEASQIDWDKFAIYGVQQLKCAHNQKELLQTLRDLFYPIAPTMQIYRKNENIDFKYPERIQKSSGYSVVAWQHKGLGQGIAQSIYWSIRLNRDNKFLVQGYGFGTSWQFVDARSLWGAEIKLSAAVRMDVHGFGNQGQLWLRVDRKNNNPGFFNNMETNPIFSPSWKKYEIAGRVDQDAAQVVFGCFLKGKGKMWVDDVQLLIKKQNGIWKKLKLKNSGFEVGKVDKAPPQWFVQSPGYTYEITDINPFVGKKCLLIKNEYVVFRGKLFDRHSKIGEFIEEDLGANLKCKIPLAVLSDGKNTLGKNEKFRFDKLEKSLDTINPHDLTNADENLRLANIVIAWNVFQHFYPYFEEIKINWDQALTKFLIKSLKDKNDCECLLTLKKMVAMLKDGHANVFHKCAQKQLGLPFKVDWIEDQIVIVASKDRRFLKGDVVTAVNSIEATHYLKYIESYISGSPQFKKYRAMQEFGLGKEGSKVKLVLKRGEKSFEIEVKRNYYGIFSEFDNPKFKQYRDNIFYVNLKKASMEDINSIIDKLARAKGVIFDLRGYPNKNHGLLSYLLKDRDTSMDWMRIPLIIYPDHKNIVGYQKMGWSLVPKKPRIIGKVIFLIDSSAYSYSESFLSFIEHYKLAQILGQPTAGANGNVNTFFLPGGFSISWTGMKVVKHNGSQHHLVGIQPTYWLSRTIEGVKENRDEFLDKALEIITK